MTIRYIRVVEYIANDLQDFPALGRRNADRVSIWARQANDHPEIDKKGWSPGLRMSSHQIVHRPVAMDSLQIPSQSASLRR